MYCSNAGLPRIILHRHIVYGQPRSGYVRVYALISSWLSANRDLRKRVATYYVGPWVPGCICHTTDNSIASNGLVAEQANATQANGATALAR
jgi:hypothetical protein